MKHSHAAEDYADRSHKESVAVLAKFNRAIYFNFNFNRSFDFNFKIEHASAVNNLA
jgi:hypothetical protein